jgi:hypothetical protein
MTATWREGGCLSAPTQDLQAVTRAELLALYRDGTRAENVAARMELDRRRAERRQGPTTADTRARRWPRDDWRRRQAGDA